MSHVTDRRLAAPPVPDLHLVRDAVEPGSFDLAAFCERVAGWRGRPIRLLAVYSRPPRGACLPWFEADATDFVLVEQNSPRLIQELLALHTIGHLLLGHQGRPVPADVLMAGRMPDLDWQRLRPLLGPVVHVAGPHAEAAADAVAVDILARAGRIPRAQRPVPATDVVVGRP